MKRSLLRKAPLGVFLILLSLLLSCHWASKGSVAGGGDTLALKYARQLTMVRHPHYTVVSLSDPWHAGQTLHTYILVDRKDSAQAAPLPHGTVIYTPVKRSVVFTTVHAALLYELQASQAISGVCDLSYIQIPDVQRRVARHQITDCGNSMNADIERIASCRPQALFVSPYENNGGYGKLAQMGIPIVEAADYMEATPLGRAEWMVFYGMLYGREAEARQLFAETEKRYQQLRAEGQKAQRRPTVITERKTGGVWYVPGGHSFMAQLISDAGGHYAFAHDKSEGSLSLSFEQVLSEAGQAEVWLYKYGDHPATLAELKAEYAGYAEMKAFRCGQVFGADTNKNHYFEEAPFHPDYLLRDLLLILHPEGQRGSLRYYHPLREK